MRSETKGREIILIPVSVHLHLKYLFSPVLESLLALPITLFAMEEEQSDQGAEHAAENAKANDNIHPNSDVHYSVDFFAALQRREAVH